MEVGLGPCHIVLDGDPAPRKWGTTPSNFWPMSIVAKRMEGSRCHLVRRQDSAQATLCKMRTQLPFERGSALFPTFLPMSVCKTAGWIRAQLSTEVGLGLGDIVLDRDPAPRTERCIAPTFGPHLLWPNGCPSQQLQRHTCLRCTSAQSALEALHNALYKFSTYFTYLLTDSCFTY